MQKIKTKNLWEIYAAQKGLVSKNHLKQHPERSERGQAPETSGGDSVKRGRKIKKKGK